MTPAAKNVSFADTSLIERAGLNRSRLARALSHGLDGADDGEIYLEYKEAETLILENSRLTDATYSTTQGLGCAPSRARRWAMRTPPNSPMTR